MTKFVFGVITYNHAEYIIEHLESIKFLIVNYGSSIKFKLVIGDDGSKDTTVSLFNNWLKENSHLFEEIVILADGINRGTCRNYTNLCEHIDSPFFKITAGDDVYSYVNLFEIMINNPDFDYISGMPLLLLEGELIESKSTIIHTYATKHIFRRRPFSDRMKEISVMNVPNLIYSIKYIKDPEVIEFIQKFRVTEDFPMMVKLSEKFPDVRFDQLNEVLVYYRRTKGSTYLIKADHFNMDKVGVFSYLIENEKSFIKKLLLRNRLWCYTLRRPILKKILNISYYIYTVRFLIRFPRILGDYNRFEIDMTRHRKHYEQISRISSG